jgi:hypothetical protein
MEQTPIGFKERMRRMARKLIRRLELPAHGCVLMIHLLVIIEWVAHQ